MAKLVILGSTLTALAVARDAHAHGIEPVVIDTHEGIAFCSRWVKSHSLPSDSGDAQVLSQLLDVADGSYLVATGDPWVRFVMRHRTELDSSYQSVLHPANAMLELCMNKERFSVWCEANDLPAPRAWLAAESLRPDDLAPPFLVRPVETLHGRPDHGLPKAVEARDEAELASWLSRFAAARCRALVTESLLGQPLTQYSIPFARAKGELLSFVARKLRPGPHRCSVGTCVELAPQPDVEALGRRAAHALQYFGIGEAEVLRSEATGRNYLIEINSRPWLQYPLAPASGHDFLGLLTDQPAKLRRQVKTGRRWIDLPSDLFGALSSSVGEDRQSRLAMSAYLASLLRANVYARFDMHDIKPAFYRQATTSTMARANGAGSTPDHH